MADQHAIRGDRYGHIAADTTDFAGAVYATGGNLARASNSVHQSSTVCHWPSAQALARCLGHQHEQVKPQLGMCRDLEHINVHGFGHDQYDWGNNRVDGDDDDDSGHVCSGNSNDDTDHDNGNYDADG